MTLGEMIAEFAAKVGDPALKRYRPDQVIRWLNDGSKDVASKTNIIERSKTASAVSAQVDYQLPLDHIETKFLEYTNASGTTIQLMPVNIVQLRNTKNYRTTITTPSVFAEWEGLFTVYAAPAANVTNGFNLYYYAIPNLLSDLNDISELPEQYHDLPVLYSAYRAKQSDKEKFVIAGKREGAPPLTEAQLILQEYTNRVQLMNADLIGRRTDRIPKMRDLGYARKSSIRTI